MEHVVTFAGGKLDRAGHQRKDELWLRAQLLAPDSRFLPLWHLRPLMQPGDDLTISWRSRSDVATYIEMGAILVFLGLLKGVPHFAVDVSSAGKSRSDAPFREDGKWIDVRSAAANTSMEDAAILAQSRSMIDWHLRHGYCASCGSPTELREAGYMRKCDPCGAQHFPRTDPVMICLVLDENQNCMLGRQAIWPKGNYSALAGFMEPGENLEEAVRREVMEESGIPIGEVRYVCSQPWPFPSSLMIGCWAYATSTDIHVDQEELEEAIWFSRDEIKVMLTRYDQMDQIRMPAPLAIAHQLAQLWINDTET